MSDSRFPRIGEDRLGRRHFLAGLAVVGLGTLAACSSGGSGTSQSSSGGGAAATAAARVSGGLNAEASAAKAGTPTVVQMTNDNKFDPATVTIQKGGTVTWKNVSSATHTATFDPSKAANKSDVSLPSGVKPFDSGPVSVGNSWSHTFTVAGTYKYICVPHEQLGMIGTVIVK